MYITYWMTELEYGGIFVKEKTAPTGFVMDENAYYVFIDTDGKTYEIENEAGKGFINQSLKGSLKIIKTTSDGKKEGFAFRVTGANGYDMTFTTDANGAVSYTHLPLYFVSVYSYPFSSSDSLISLSLFFVTLYFVAVSLFVSPRY